jgi:hypothetical protein
VTGIPIAVDDLTKTQRGIDPWSQNTAIELRHPREFTVERSLALEG